MMAASSILYLPRGNAVPTDSSFKEMMELLRSGDQAAAELIFKARSRDLESD